tara:strand:- start:2863 stop:4542 length:1680 start_codon:yes stop_codon:yes gene_type:complete
MKKFIIIIFLANQLILYSQKISLNKDFIYNNLRYQQLIGEISPEFSFTLRPINLNNLNTTNFNYLYKNIKLRNTKKLKIKLLPVEYIIEFNSNYPYNRNNGSMIPNKGYQHIVSLGLNINYGPINIKLNPEHHFSENKKFPGFWEEHFPYVWVKRYKLWNKIDMPERFGNQNHNRLLIGQSSISLNWKGISIGFSNENIWWGPSIRNSIMMSNHSEGFRHLTFNTTKPIKTKIGNFEWQVIAGRLESSGYLPPNSDLIYSGSKLYTPRINQLGERNDWRYLQGYTLTYSPNFIKGLSVGFIRWVQMYSALLKGEYTWMEGVPSYFPAFSNLFRSSDKYDDIEFQMNQAAGLFLRWLWIDSKAEIYAEFHHNDSKLNIRDLMLDSDHSRAVTIGLQKVFKINTKNILFNWEWTQMEQTAGRLVRDAGSWYEHGFVYDGYTNRGEVLGSSIGPGSNSHYFSLMKYRKKDNLGIAFEVIDQDNDFYYEAFSSSKDFRRYWKDFNFHLKYDIKFNNFHISSRAVFIRSLNYQWELNEIDQPYYQPGTDKNNFHLSLKVLYFVK